MKVQKQKSIHKRILTDGPLDITPPQSNSNGNNEGLSHRCFNQDYLPKIKKTITKQHDMPIYLSNNAFSKPKLSNKKLVSRGNNLYLSTDENTAINITQNYVSSTKATHHLLDSSKTGDKSNYLFKHSHTGPVANNKLKLVNKKANQTQLVSKENKIEVTLSKKETKDTTTTITPLNHFSNLDAISTPEELHLIFVQFVQKGKAIQKRFDIDNESFKEDMIFTYDY